MNEGSIKVNDIPIEKYNIYSLRKEIAYVIQNNPIMEGSIQHNLTYGIDKRCLETHYNLTQNLLI